jgi:hypothetical protein
MTYWLALGALATLSYGWYARKRNKQRRRYEIHITTFYESVRPLISDEDTPVEILRLLRFLNGEISNPTAARFAVLAMRSSSKSYLDAKNNSEISSLDSIVEEFLRKRPELGKKLIQAIAAAMLAVSYNSLIFGYFLRFILAGTPESNPKQAVIVAEKMKASVGHPAMQLCAAQA